MPLEENGGEWREGKDQGIRTALRGLLGGLLAASVADVRTPVVGGVAIEDFAVETGIRDAETVAAADYRRGVDDGDDQVFRFFAATNKRENAVIGVVGVDPFEAVPVEVDFMKRRFGGVKMIEIADEMLDAAMRFPLKQMPIEAASFAPLVALREFLAHEEKFLAGMRVLISVQQAEIRELLPRVSRHLVKKRIFSVDDFVMGEREKKIFRESIEQGKGQFVVFVLAMHGIVRKIF